MTAPIAPCLTAGEAKDSLARVARWIEAAKDEAEAIRAGAELGVCEPWHLAYAAELRATALSLAGILGSISAAVSAETTTPPSPRLLAETRAQAHRGEVA